MNRNEKPLTLDEMRQMNGKPVQYEANGEIFIVDLDNPDFGECLVNAYGYYIPLHRAVDRSAGRRFFAYERPQIDREAWEPCEYCGGDVDDRPFLDSKDFYIAGNNYISSVSDNRDLFPLEYCPVCGRPLTDSAWKQLEERLM